MSIKNIFPVDIKLDSHYNPYLLDGTEFQPNIFHKRNEKLPLGGESIVICWNLEQTEGFFISFSSYSAITALCLNLNTMKMSYCYSLQDAKEFYEIV